jgi:hypothetical protein
MAWSSSPTTNTLPAVAGQEAHEAVLDGVGVLELVHQQVAKSLAVVRQQRWVVAQQFMRAQQQLGEVDQAGASVAPRPGRRHRRAAAGPARSSPRLDVLGPRPSSFCALIHQADLARRVRPRPAPGLHHALDQAQLVVAVQHLETLRQLRLLPVQAQQAVRQTMEGADPHVPRSLPHRPQRAATICSRAGASRRRPCW